MELRKSKPVYAAVILLHGEGMLCLSQWFSPQFNCTTTAQSLDKNTKQYNSEVCTCKLAQDTLLTTM